MKWWLCLYILYCRTAMFSIVSVFFASNVLCSMNRPEIVYNKSEEWYRKHITSSVRRVISSIKIKYVTWNKHILHLQADVTYSTEIYYVVLFWAFFNICLNPFVSATKYDMISRHLSRLVRCNSNIANTSSTYQSTTVHVIVAHAWLDLTKPTNCILLEHYTMLMTSDVPHNA